MATELSRLVPPSKKRRERGIRRERERIKKARGVCGDKAIICKGAHSCGRVTQRTMVEILQEYNQ